ncbi:hypothetical protein V6N11_043584 [Hibiscus sabdariffa]|uniref:Uncharacterized protein n=1 Tax=Hibiscus sabdariffa TaxID=183260 RepID=A0ABR2RCY8_9ROSI
MEGSYNGPELGQVTVVRWASSEGRPRFEHVASSGPLLRPSGGQLGRVAFTREAKSREWGALLLAVEATRAAPDPSNQRVLILEMVICPFEPDGAKSETRLRSNDAKPFKSICLSFSEAIIDCFVSIAPSADDPCIHVKVHSFHINQESFPFINSFVDLLLLLVYRHILKFSQDTALMSCFGSTPCLHMSVDCVQM